MAGVNALLGACSASELPAQAIGPFQVALDLRLICPMYRVKVHVLNNLNAWIAETPFVDEHFHGIADASIVRALVEDRRLYNQRLFVLQQR